MDNSFLSHADAALRNRNHLIHFIKKHGPISRTDIWERMNMSRASVTQVIRQLQDNDLILEVGEGVSTGGRKPRFIMFNAAAKKLFVFDWNARSLYLTDFGGTVLYEVKLPLEKEVSPDSFAEQLLQSIQRIKAEKLCREDEIVGFVLALPGLINSRAGAVIYSVELGWQNVDVEKLLSAPLGLPIYLERTGNTMALGACNQGKQTASSHFQLFILGSDGIGVSTVIHGNSQHGANFMHGELGHIKLADDTPCSCGQTGCLEAVVNRLFLENNRRITKEILDNLAIGIAAAVNIADPEEIMFVGSFVEAMNPEQETYLMDSVRNKVTGSGSRRLEIRFSRNAKQMALAGLCAYGFDCYFALE